MVLYGKRPAIRWNSVQDYQITLGLSCSIQVLWRNYGKLPLNLYRITTVLWAPRSMVLYHAGVNCYHRTTLCIHAAHWFTKHRNKVHIMLSLKQCDGIRITAQYPWPYISKLDSNPTSVASSRISNWVATDVGDCYLVH